MLTETLLLLIGSIIIQTGHLVDLSFEDNHEQAVLVAQSERGDSRSAVERPPQLHGQTKHEFTVNLRRQSYILYTPAAYQSDTALPLVIILGDFNTRTRRFIHYIKFNELADRNAFVVAYPDVYKDKTLLEITGKDGGAGQAIFLQQLIKDIAQQRNIRTEQIYLVGFSTGGVAVLSALCQMTEKISGFAVVSASLPRQLRSQCTAKQKIPGLLIVGRDDPYIAWQMGDSEKSGIDAGLSTELLPVLQTVEYWTGRNRCDFRPLIQAIPNNDVRDGTSVTRLAYDGHCLTNKPIILYAVTGGGHSWPGNQYQAPFEDAGRTSQDINASEEIWKFFSNTVQSNQPTASNNAPSGN